MIIRNFLNETLTTLRPLLIVDTNFNGFVTYYVWQVLILAEFGSLLFRLNY